MIRKKKLTRTACFLVGYIQDKYNMKEKLWFKRRRLGWGWRPVSKEGWTVTIVFLVIILGLGLTLDPDASDKEVLFSLFIPLGILIAALLRILFTHGEKPRFQWKISKKRWFEKNSSVDNF